MIEIWGKTMCPYCDMAKRLCETNGYDFTYKQLGEDFDREEVFEHFPNARTFPQITMDGEYIGGFTELDAHLS